MDTRHRLPTLKGKAMETPRYCDYYGMLSYKDFLLAVAAGTLTQHGISRRTDI